jgi:flagellar biosynthesis protein FlhF
MNVKTIEGRSIQAALAEARRVLGDEVVLLDSVPARDDRPARVTVMLDAAPADATPERRRSVGHTVPTRQGASAQASRRTPERRASTERAANRRTAQPAGGRGEQVSDGTGGLVDVMEDSPIDVQGLAERMRQLTASARRTQDPARGDLFPKTGAAANDSPPPSSSADLEALLESQLRVLHDRLETMERRFGGAVIGAGHRWAAHPLYAQLLERGMAASTLTKVFDQLAEHGYDPETDQEKLQWALAQELLRRLQHTAPSKQTTGTQLLIGPSGSGKTSLLLKLALHPQFFARRQPAVIVIEPDPERESLHHSPLELFRRHGLPAQSVQTEDEMREALRRVQSFDQLLIDTPPLPVRPADARRMMQRLRRFVAPILPLHVQLVFNATRALGEFPPEVLTRLPLAPDALALTHLDEVLGWGRVAEWLLQFDLPVQHLTNGPHVPHSVRAFSPTWFVQSLLNL